MDEFPSHLQCTETMKTKSFNVALTLRLSTKFKVQRSGICFIICYIFMAGKWRIQGEKKHFLE